MTKDEFKIKHGFTDEELDTIVDLLKTGEGKIVDIYPLPKNFDSKIWFNNRKKYKDFS